ncbi:hypothetical protein V3C99_004425 [Haemonchus contortus]|uniref:Uncharacterized protein n=1 Tax=Haemonchus contortus TaxID=6289 RepID=A0A7I4XW58_HAECO
MNFNTDNLGTSPSGVSGCSAYWDVRNARR